MADPFDKFASRLNGLDTGAAYGTSEEGEEEAQETPGAPLTQAGGD